MPNQRKKGKAQVSVWLTKEERQSLQRLGNCNATTIADTIRWLITAACKAMDRRTGKNKA
jgi:hypothetical protein